MAVTCGFFNAENGSPRYNADQISSYFDGIVNQGVFQNFGQGLEVTAGTGLSVSVADGRAIVQSKWVNNDAALTLNISTASTTQPRIDAVVIKLDRSARSISILVKTGTPASSPSAPEMTRTDSVYEMALAYVNVAANATSVTVTDKRADTSVCGWATVAQSTSGEVDAMLDAMKTGFDGVTYASPAAMVQGEDEKLAGNIDYTQNILAGLRFHHIKMSESGFFINLSGTTVDIDNPSTSSGWRYAVVSCSEGDVFYISGTGGASPRLWAFADSSKNIISKASEGAFASDMQIVAPENASYLIINDNSSANSFIGVPEFADAKYSKTYYESFADARTKTRKYNFTTLNYSGFVYENRFVNSGGVEDYNSSVILTKGYLPEGFIVIPKEGYSISLIEYTSEDVFVSRSAFVTTPQWMTIGKKYRMQMQRTDGTVINASEINNVIISPRESDSVEYDFGLVSNVNGGISYNLTKLCSTSFIPESVKMIGLTNTNYKIVVGRWNKTTLAFVDRSTFTTGPITLDHSTYKYMFQLTKADDSQITLSEADAALLVTDDTPLTFISGVIASGGGYATAIHGCVATDYIPENVKGVFLKSAKYEIAIAKYNKTTEAFISRYAFIAAPDYSLDHDNYKYKLCVITTTETKMDISDVYNYIEFSKEYPGMDAFKYSFGISDQEKYLSGDGTQCVIDEDRGMMYVLYNAGTNTYGESYAYYDLAVFPIHQPFRVQYYNVYTAGTTYGELTFNGGQDSNLAFGDGYVRVMIYDVGTQCWWYRDFDISSGEFSDPNKMQISFDGSTYEDMTKTNIEQFFLDSSLPYSGNPTIASRMIIKDNTLYAALLPTAIASKPVLISSDDNGETFSLETIIPVSATIECGFAYTDRWYIVSRMGGLYWSNDDFEHVTQIKGITCDGTRPDMFILDGDIVACVSKTSAMFSTGNHDSDRTNVVMYKGSGADSANYEIMKPLQNPNGCTYYRIMNFKGVLYYVGTCGELYPDKHWAGAQCKDGVYYIKLGYPENMKPGKRYS